MQNPIQKFRQRFIVFEKPGSLFEKLKTLTSSKYFLLKFDTYFLFTNVYKRVLGIFFISFRSWVIKKTGFCEGVETRSFSFFANNSRSKQNKKNPEHPFLDIGKNETCAKFQQSSSLSKFLVF